MIVINDERDCCGCGACSVSCPVGCITMTEGSLGHMFPKIDIGKCIKCDRCNAVCPINNKPIVAKYEQKVYAAYSKENEIRYNGSSGGMFGTFAKHLISKDYIVYGAAFDENLNLKCVKADNLDDLKPLLKSKYLQSSLIDEYEEIKQDLKMFKKVLFVSTPCQVAALKNFLKKDYENLITIDFFCHGVPSQKFFDQCKSVDEKRLKGKILSYSFRSKKKNGSTPHYYTIIYKKNNKIHEKIKLYFNSSFYAAFQKYICLRESCYECLFATEERISDITIGDFHDIDKYISGINRFQGVSTVVINSTKGENLWDSCKNDMIYYNMDRNKLMRDGTIFAGGTKKPENRENFVKDYNEKSIYDLADKWMNPKEYWKQNIYYSLPRKIRVMLMKLMGDKI